MTYNHLDIIDTQKRFFSAWATMDVQDSHGDYVNVKDLEKFLPIFLDRIPPLHLEHTSKTVGKVVNAWVENDNDGKKGIMLVGRIYEDTVLDNTVWEMIKNGKIKGVSIGGEAKREGEYLNSPKTWEVSLTETPANKRAKLMAVNTFAKKIAKEVPANSVPFDDPSDVPEDAKIITGPDGGKYYIPPIKEEREKQPEMDDSGSKPPEQGEVRPRTIEEYFHVRIIDVCKELQLPDEVMVIFEKQVFEALRNYDPKEVIANENRFMNILRAHAQKLKEYYSETLINKKMEDINEEEIMDKSEDKKDNKKPFSDEKKEEKPKNTPNPTADNNPEPPASSDTLSAPPPLDFGFDDTEIRSKLANLEAQISKILEMISSAPIAPDEEKDKGEYMEEEKIEETKKSEIKEPSMEEIIKSSIEPFVKRLEEMEKKLSAIEEVKKAEEVAEEEVKKSEEIVAKTPEPVEHDVTIVTKSGGEIDWSNSKNWDF